MKSKRMNKREIFDIVCEEIYQVLGQKAFITGNETLEELGLDSLDVAGMISTLSNKIDVDEPDENFYFDKSDTVGEIVDHILMSHVEQNRNISEQEQSSTVKDNGWHTTRLNKYKYDLPDDQHGHRCNVILSGNPYEVLSARFYGDHWDVEGTICPHDFILGWIELPEPPQIKLL